VVSLDLQQPSSFRQIVNKKHRLLLRKMWDRWINGRLRVLLGGAAFVQLDLLDASEFLNHSLRKDIRELMKESDDLPAGISIVQFYEQADGVLLVLGEPGAGKTIQLLFLARELLLQAAQHESAPLPVVFHLGSWPKEQTSLEEWVVRNLHTFYDIPEPIGRNWMETDQLVLLLDGLDETSEEARAACVQAMQAYLERHPLASLIVCCLRETYAALPVRLAFHHTACIKPLTSEQIERYLAGAPCQREAVKTALQEDPILQEICTNPLMLEAVTRIFRDKKRATLVLSGSIEMRRQQIFETYVQERTRRSQAEMGSPPEQATSWLAYLAWHMQQGNLDDLYIERLQPSWLQTEQLRRAYQNTVIRLVMGIHCLIAGGLFAWLKGGLKNGVMGSGNGILGLFGGGAGNSMLGWMAPGLGGGTQGGASLVIILGVVIWLVSVLVGSSSPPVIRPRAIGRGIVSGVKAGVLLGVATAVLSTPLFTLRGGVHYGLVYGLGTGFVLAMLMGLMRGLATGLRYGQPAAGKERVAKRSDHVRDGLVWGMCGTLGFVAVEECLRVNQQSTMLYSCIVFLFFFLAYGLGGGDRLFASLPVEGIEPTEMVVWSWSAMVQDLGYKSLRSALVALVVGISVGVVTTMMSSLFLLDLAYGVHYGLVFGTISGLIVGIAGLLATMVKSGWSSDILPKEQHRRTNEGILRSGKNALLGACLFAPIGGIASGLACGIGFGLIGQLAAWPAIAMSFAVMLTLMLFVIFLTAHGAVAWVEHYTLRWYLSRAGYLPRELVHFLNDAVRCELLLKVEGGYLFWHRLVREHFAALYQTAPPARNASGPREGEEQTSSNSDEQATLEGISVPEDDLSSGVTPMRISALHEQEQSISER
jgi:DNA polymerase III delta prime subunit